MRILFFDTKTYDKESFEKQTGNYPGIEIDYLKTDLALQDSAVGQRI